MQTANDIDEVSTEKQGVKIGLITTQGCLDVSELTNEDACELLNTQNKQSISSIAQHLRREVSERMNQKGEIISGLDFDEVENILQDFKAEGVQAIVISLLHSCQNNDHERAMAYYIKKYHPDFSVTYSTADYDQRTHNPINT